MGIVPKIGDRVRVRFPPVEPAGREVAESGAAAQAAHEEAGSRHDNAVAASGSGLARAAGTAGVGATGAAGAGVHKEREANSPAIAKQRVAQAAHAQ